MTRSRKQARSDRIKSFSSASSTSSASEIEVVIAPSPLDVEPSLAVASSRLDRAMKFGRMLKRHAGQHMRSQSAAWTPISVMSLPRRTPEVQHGCPAIHWLSELRCDLLSILLRLLAVNCIKLILLTALLFLTLHLARTSIGPLAVLL